MFIFFLRPFFFSFILLHLKKITFFFTFFGGCAQSSFAARRFCLVAVSGATLSCAAEASHGGASLVWNTVLGTQASVVATVSRAGLSGVVHGL